MQTAAAPTTIGACQDMRHARRGIALLLSAVLAASCSAASEQPSTVTASIADVGPVVSDAEQLQAWRQSIAEQWKVQNPPQVEVVQFVPVETVQPLVDACMESKGFVKGTDDAWEVPSEQRDVFNLAFYECRVSYPPEPRTLQPLTDEQRLKVYEYLVGTLTPCLAAEGFDVSAAPTPETFVATFDVDQYSPYTDVLAQLTNSQKSNEYFAALEDRCPQYPSSDVLWG